MDVINHSLNERAVARLKRALGKAETANILEQPLVQQEIANIVDFLNPFRQRLPRRPGQGSAWLLNRRDPGTTGAEFINDTEEPPEETGAYTRVSFDYKILATRGKITNFSQAIGRNYRDVLMDELRFKLEEFRDKEEKWVLFGDASVNAKEWDGFWTLMTAGQKLAMTNATGGAEVTLAKLDEVIDQNRGRPSMILCSRAFRRQLQSKLQAQQRFVDEVEIAAGFRVLTYQGLPVVPTTNIPNTVFVNGDTAPTQAQILGGTGQTTIVFVFDFENEWFGELQRLTTEALANKSSQFDEFDIFEYGAPVLFNTLKISALYNVKI